MKQLYLGDGLYVRDEGFQFRLFTERGAGNVHEVYLDDHVLTSFVKFIELARNLKITIEEKNEPTGPKYSSF